MRLKSVRRPSIKYNESAREHFSADDTPEDDLLLSPLTFDTEVGCLRALRDIANFRHRRFAKWLVFLVPWMRSKPMCWVGFSNHLIISPS